MLLTQVGNVRHGFHLILYFIFEILRKNIWYSSKKFPYGDQTKIFIPDPKIFSKTYPNPGLFSDQSSPVQGYSGFWVAPQGFTLYTLLKSNLSIPPMHFNIHVKWDKVYTYLFACLLSMPIIKKNSGGWLFYILFILVAKYSHPHIQMLSSLIYIVLG